MGMVMAMAHPGICDMGICDLNSAGLVTRPHIGVELAADIPPADLGGLVPAGTDCVAIRFARFSDGRGFTLARHLREVRGHGGAILACGHLIPDQAVYLARCGFSHVEIAPGSLPHWQRALSFSPPVMQQVLSSRRARDHRAATS